MRLEHLLTDTFGIELIYSFIIIVCSLMIYFATKEMYELSSYKGLKYFRQAFLFFAIAYFFRFFIQAFIGIFNLEEVFEFSPRLIGFITMFIFIYASSMAVFYLLYSLMWKKWQGKKIYLFHGLAVLIAMVILLFRSRLVMLLIQVSLFLFLAIISYKYYNKSENRKKHIDLYAIYLLVFAFLVLNMIGILIPPFIQPFHVVVYLVSCFLFLLILYKVLKKIGSD